MIAKILILDLHSYITNTHILSGKKFDNKYIDKNN